MRTESDYTAQEEKRKKKKGLLIFLIILLFLISAAGVVYLVWVYYNNYMAVNTYEQIAQSYVEEVKEPELAENPVDFASLQKINPDVYAWIKVPNTKIDYPILQNAETDYYLRRSIYKKYLFAGSIYTNAVNKKDFSDPITVIYGHNMRNDTMFCMLHEFESKAFFDQNEFFYIYLPGRKLTYRIVSALKYDNRRITYAYDFNKKEDVEEFQYSITTPKYDLFNARDVALTTEDKIVTLSTCVANTPPYRYLVNGVLISDEPTK